MSTRRVTKVNVRKGLLLVITTRPPLHLRERGRGMRNARLKTTHFSWNGEVPMRGRCGDAAAVRPLDINIPDRGVYGGKVKVLVSPAKSG